VIVTDGLCSVQWSLFMSHHSHWSMAERSLRVTAPSGALTGNETTQVRGSAGSSPFSGAIGTPASLRTRAIGEEAETRTLRM
jgi:hypothetical protein